MSAVVLFWGFSPANVGIEGDQVRLRWRSDVVDFGLRDAKGRAIGGGADIEFRHAKAVYGLGPVQYSGGMHYYVSTRATRDGKVFGAIPRETRCETLEDAKALAEKKVGEQRKRYERAVAKGEGKQFRKAGAS